MCIGLGIEVRSIVVLGLAALGVRSWQGLDLYCTTLGGGGGGGGGGLWSGVPTEAGKP